MSRPKSQIAAVLSVSVGDGNYVGMTIYLPGIGQLYFDRRAIGLTPREAAKHEEHGDKDQKPTHYQSKPPPLPSAIFCSLRR
jgi:hypothetical protein